MTTLIGPDFEPEAVLEVDELAPDELLELDDDELLELLPHAASATVPKSASTVLGTALLNFRIVPPPQRLWVP